jgi:hypothetical protein
MQQRRGDGLARVDRRFAQTQRPQRHAQGVREVVARVRGLLCGCELQEQAQPGVGLDAVEERGGGHGRKEIRRIGGPKG